MRRTFFAIALTGSLLASMGGRPGLLDQFWALLSSIWTAEGCSWDPNGTCIQPQADEGCGWDPDGRCNPAPLIDAGCGMDPNGCPQGS